MKTCCLLLLLCTFSCLSAFAQSCKHSAVYFKSGRYTLTKKHKQQLDTILSSFSQTEFYLVELHGMTDTTDSRDFNLELAQKRIASVKAYFTARGLNIDFIERNTGESIITEGGDAANRRVDTWYVQLTTTKSVVLQGELGESILVPVKTFNDCGYCTTDLKLKSEWTTNELAPGQTERFLHTTIESNCDTISGRQPCISAELHIPFSLYNSASELKVPRPLEFRDCCNRNDSLSINWLRGITIDLDTILQEYVVTVPCYNFYNNCICCATQHKPCPKYKLNFPENFSKLQTYVIQNRDTTQVYTDSLYVLCDPKLESYGYLDGRFVYLKTDWKNLDKTPVPDPLYPEKAKRIMHYRVEVKNRDYSPLLYSTIKVRIKTQKRAGIDSTGYYVSNFNLYIPAPKTTPRTFENARLESRPFQFLFYSAGKTYVLYSSQLKTHYNKKKKILKVKVKKKHLSQPVEIKDLVVVPNG